MFKKGRAQALCRAWTAACCGGADDGRDVQVQGSRGHKVNVQAPGEYRGQVAVPANNIPMTSFPMIMYEDTEPVRRVPLEVTHCEVVRSLADILEDNKLRQARR